MKTECLACSAPTMGVWLCRTHTRHLFETLNRFPGLVADLETTTAKLDRMVRNVGGTSKGGAQPVIVNFDAAELLTETRRWLLTWTHNATQARTRAMLRSFSLPHMAVYLRESMPAMLPAQPVGAMYDELLELTRRITRVIDLPPDRAGWDYAGPCGAVFDNGTCPNQLWVRHGETTTTCERCGTSWDVTERRTGALAAAENLQATAGTISRALTAAGQTVTVNMIYHWRSRGQLTPAETNKTGQPLYRVGDVLDILKGGV